MIADPWLRRASDVIEVTVAAMTPEALAWHLPDKWSSAEVLEHLGKSYGTTAYILEKCVREARTVATPPSWRQWLLTHVLLTLRYFPSGVRAPAVTKPDGLISPLEALASARMSLAALDIAAQKSAARFGAHVAVANHPLLGGFTTAQWRRFHWRHTRHHMRQIARLSRNRPPT